MERTKTEIRRELAEARRELRKVINAAGDDFGCDGTAEEAKSWRWEIAGLESELANA
jgi:hypothetical protein